MEPYYDQGGITIYHGDCREILPTLEKVDLVLTDPPYGINHESHGQIFVHADKCQNDESQATAIEVLTDLEEIPQAVFYSPYNPFPIKWRSILAWHKGEDFGIGGDRATCWKRDFELIGVRNNTALIGNRDSALMQFRGVKSSVHFCEKPIPLLKHLLIKLGGQTILDPFMGSGTTLRAAKDLGRQAIGIEIEEKYCEIAANRLRQGVLDFS